MLVNYKGRPWMKGATENPGLLYSLAACITGVVVAAWEMVPMLNAQLGLVEIPDAATKRTLLLVIATTLVGTLVWDRLMLAIFAPRILRCQIQELQELKLADVWGEKSARNVLIAIAAACWLYFTEGNLMVLGGCYWLSRRMAATPTAQNPNAPQQQAAR